jgi:hypothetical protein
MEKDILNQWDSLQTWEERERFHSLLEADETVSFKVFDEIDKKYWAEHYARQRCEEEGTCPDCQTKIKDHSYSSESTGHNVVREFSCAC